MGLVITLVGAVGALQLLNLWLNGPRSYFEAVPRKFHRSLNLFVRENRIPPLVWSDVVDNLASAVRAGMSLPQAVCELSTSGPVVVRKLFETVRIEYLNSGNFQQALGVITRSSHSGISAKFVAALNIAYDVGGTDLGKVLRTLSGALREDVNTRLEIRARQSWTINGARIAVAAPWATALLLSSRSQAAQAYFSPQGIRMLIGCAVLSVMAYFVMIRLSRLPHELGSAL